MLRYQIAEWYGEPFVRMSPPRRRELANAALGNSQIPICPFQKDHRACSKKGGVCSLQFPDSTPVTICPNRFAEENLIPNWLAEIVNFNDAYIAREVPFMRSPTTNRSAGRIDLVVANDKDASSWYGLEMQAVYFSGEGMQSDFELILRSHDVLPPQPTALRRPDWRSSSAKRLMPQLQVKVPTLRRWGTKLAVAVDQPFFTAIGGPSEEPSTDLNDGDIIWLVPRINDDYTLQRFHWEVLSLEESSNKLLSAKTVNRQDFENILRGKLIPIE